MNTENIPFTAGAFDLYNSIQPIKENGTYWWSLQNLCHVLKVRFLDAFNYVSDGLDNGTIPQACVRRKAASKMVDGRECVFYDYVVLPTVIDDFLTHCVASNMTDNKDLVGLLSSFISMDGVTREYFTAGMVTVDAHINNQASRPPATKTRSGRRRTRPAPAASVNDISEKMTSSAWVATWNRTNPGNELSYNHSKIMGKTNSLKGLARKYGVTIVSYDGEVYFPIWFMDKYAKAVIVENKTQKSFTNDAKSGCRLALK